MGCTIFTFVCMIISLFNHGNFELLNYSFIKMALGSICISLGYCLPSMIYDNEVLSSLSKVFIHMGIGCSNMLIISLIVGWIPIHLGFQISITIISIMIISSFIIWYCFYLYYKMIAKKMNQKIAQKKL